MNTEMLLQVNAASQTAGEAGVAEIDPQGVPL
jgi:hypothetical protein